MKKKKKKKRKRKRKTRKVPAVVRWLIHPHPLLLNP
jgi:hypothetical protein